MPPITRVYKTTRDGKRLTLEQECLQSGTLPSMAYGFKRCSPETQDRAAGQVLQPLPALPQGMGGRGNGW